MHLSKSSTKLYNTISRFINDKYNFSNLILSCKLLNVIVKTEDIILELQLSM